jgi:hypothetical protein
MPIPNEASVKAALLPFRDRIRRVVDSGFRRHRQRGANLFTRTDAANIFDFVIQAALREFGSDSDVKVFHGQATARFLFKNKVLVRFKQGDEEGRGNNISTEANSKFLNPRLPFIDAPEAMKVEICWLKNALGTNFDSIVVTARDGEAVLWSFALFGGAQEVLPLPMPKPAPVRPRRSVVKLKGAQARKPSGKRS